MEYRKKTMRSANRCNNNKQILEFAAFNASIHSKNHCRTGRIEMYCWMIEEYTIYIHAIGKPYIFYHNFLGVEKWLQIFEVWKATKFSLLIGLCMYAYEVQRPRSQQLPACYSLT